MTSVEVPYSVACVLPSLVVLDVTNEVAREVSGAESSTGIVFITAGEGGLIRINERESGFFADVERLLALLLGAGTEQVPYSDGSLCLGQWQRILLFGFAGDFAPEWHVTVVG